MELEVGAIFPGKVTGITKFGAFVSIPNGKSGLVHISEIADSYVDDVNKHLSVGQTVNVKLISIDDNGRINLSIKQTIDHVRHPVQSEPMGIDREEPSFEDKLKRFMQDSNRKISTLYADRRPARRRGHN